MRLCAVATMKPECTLFVEELTNGSVERAVGVHSERASWRNRVCWLNTEGDGMGCHGIVVGPFDGFANMNNGLGSQETHDGDALMPATGGHDFSDPYRDGVAAKLGAHRDGVFVMVALVLIRVRQQVLALVVGLLIIEILAVRQRGRQRQDMDGTGHVFMNQADQLVIGSLREE
jgi:hypothetical protein